MSVLVCINIGLTILLWTLCLLLYVRLKGLRGHAEAQREQLDRIEISTHSLAEVQRAQIASQKGLAKRINQLASDAVQRDVYKQSGDRHQLAIADAKSGCDLEALILRHGLSSDEASLIHSLYGQLSSETVASSEEVELWSGVNR